MQDAVILCHHVAGLAGRCGARSTGTRGRQEDEPGAGAPGKRVEGAAVLQRYSDTVFREGALPSNARAVDEVLRLG
jgi:hypothetical protein